MFAVVQFGVHGLTVFFRALVLVFFAGLLLTFMAGLVFRVTLVAVDLVLAVVLPVNRSNKRGRSAGAIPGPSSRCESDDCVMARAVWATSCKGQGAEALARATHEETATVCPEASVMGTIAIR